MRKVCARDVQVVERDVRFECALRQKIAEERRVALEEKAVDIKQRQPDLV